MSQPSLSERQLAARMTDEELQNAQDYHERLTVALKQEKYTRGLIQEAKSHMFSPAIQAVIEHKELGE